jgi:N,N'-diacetyllegionaminate synthase
VSVPEVRLGGGRCLIIGEVGLAHDGSVGLAHAFIDAIAGAGADAVKFQTHIAEAESTPSEPFRVAFSRQDATRYAYWQRTAFTPDEWRGLAAHCAERGVLFLSSPFSVEAVALLDSVGMPLWKIASGEVGHAALVDRAAATRRPVVLSSGMSPLAELDAAVARVRAAGAPVAVVQCTTAYPCPPERVGLNVLEVLRARYGCPVGLSDHSGTMFPGLAAAALGADVLEVHATMSRAMFGPDVPASVTMEELRQLVDGVRFIERMRAHPVDKDAAAADTAPLRDLFTRSVVARRALSPGTVLAETDLAVKKPGTGIPGARLPELVGRRLRRAVAADQLLADDDLEASPSA